MATLYELMQQEKQKGEKQRELARSHVDRLVNDLQGAVADAKKRGAKGLGFCWTRAMYKYELVNLHECVKNLRDHFIKEGFRLVPHENCRNAGTACEGLMVIGEV